MRSSPSFSAGLKAFLLLLGDLVTLSAALALTLVVHSRGAPFETLLALHIAPFSILFIGWLVVLYIAGFYELRRLPTHLEFLTTLVFTIGVNIVLGIVFFYLVPQVGITPKTNLVIFFAIFWLLEMLWRPAVHQALRSRGPGIRVLLVGQGPTAENIYTAVSQNPQLGYSIAARARTEEKSLSAAELADLVGTHGVDLVVVPWSMKLDPQAAQLLYTFFQEGVEIRDFPTFYEHLARKVPINELGEPWLLEHLAGHQRFYDPIKAFVEFLLALVLQIVLLPLELLIALLIFLTSGAPVLYKQQRIGKNGKYFTSYKFRSFTREASKAGVRWAAPDDPHITRFGKFLRATHLDELPQLINILAGQLSFVGPRSEWHELAEEYAKQVPYYTVRQLVKPGLTGWAQINYPATPSIPDTIEKLQYDLYYIKNRSPLLDLTIIVKTLKAFVSNPR